MNTPTGARALCPGEVGKRENLFFSDAAKDERAPTHRKEDVLCLGSHGLISEGDLSLIVLLQPCLAPRSKRGWPQAQGEREGFRVRWGAQSLLLSANARQGEKGGEGSGGRKWRGGAKSPPPLKEQFITLRMSLLREQRRSQVAWMQRLP